MKNFKGTLVLLIVALGLGYYSYWDYHHSQKEKAVEAKQGRLYPDLAFSAIQEVSVERAKDSILLEKVGGKWMLKKPFEDAANKYNVQNFVTDILDEKVDQLELKNPDLSKYSLGKDAVKVTLGMDGNKKKIFYISSAAVFDGGRYLRKDGSTDIYVGKSKWSLVADKRVDDFRSRKVWQGGDNPKEVTYRSPKIKGTFTFKNIKGTWHLVGHDKVVLDDSRVDDFISNVKDLNISAFLANDEKKASLKKYHLLHPEGYVSFDGKWRFDYSHDKDAVYGTVTGRNAVFRFNKTAKDRWEKDLDYFRDKRYPFQFDKDKAVHLTFDNGKGLVQLVKQNGHWELKTKITGKTADDVQANRLLDQLKDLQVYRFLTDKKGPSHPRYSVTIKDKDGKTLFQLAWGPKAKIEKHELYVAASLQSKEVMGIEKSRLDRIADIQLVKDLPKAKAKNSKSSTKSESKTKSS